MSPGRLPDQERFIQIRKLPVDRVATVALFGCLIESAPYIGSRLRCMKSNSVNLPIQQRCNQACIYTFDDYTADEDWLPILSGSTRPRVLMLAPRRNDLNLGNRCVSAGRRNRHARTRALPRAEDEQDGSNLSTLSLQFRFIRLSLSAIKPTEAGAEFLS